MDTITEMSTRSISWVIKSGRCVRLTTYHHPVPLSRDLGNFTSWNHLGLSRPVTGLIYLFTSVWLEQRCNISDARCLPYGWDYFMMACVGRQSHPSSLSDFRFSQRHNWGHRCFAIWRLIAGWLVVLHSTPLCLSQMVGKPSSRDAAPNLRRMETSTYKLI